MQITIQICMDQLPMPHASRDGRISTVRTLESLSMTVKERTRQASVMRIRGPKGMVRRLLLLGLNHSTAPLKVRERIAFDPAARAAALAAFRMRYPRAE